MRVQFYQHEENIMKTKVRCDQCEMVSINGTACHEHGCPNSSANWDRETQEWVLQRECRDCGLTIDADDFCCQETLL